MTRTIFRAFAALAIVFAFGLAPAAAQTGQMFGELVGKVTDDQGGVLPGVTVTLSGPAAMGTPTAVDRRQRTLSLPGGQLRHLHAEVRARRVSRRSCATGIVVPVRQTITVDAHDEAGVAAGNGHRQRLVADRRRREHEGRRARCRRKC